MNRPTICAAAGGGVTRMSEKAPSQEIDDIIAMHADWRGQRLAELRRVILGAAPPSRRR